MNREKLEWLFFCFAGIGKLNRINKDWNSHNGSYTLNNRIGDSKEDLCQEKKK